MAGFCEGEFDEGASKVVILGPDCPTLDPAFVVSAFLLLDQKDVVIGPAAGGSFYLLALRKLTPDLFVGLRWGTATVLRDVVERVASSALTLGVLPPWYAVDTPDSWQMLVGHVRAMRCAGTHVALPRLLPLIDQEPPTDVRRD
jgi:glycosyltransferase A (GT-A) superfamily protein (DUF2064 family)